MGNSTQKVDTGDIGSNSFSSFLSQSHRKSRKVARLKAAKRQEAPKTAMKCHIHKKYNTKIIYIYRLSEATLSTFPVFLNKGLKSMGKSTHKVEKGDIVSNLERRACASRSPNSGRCASRAGTPASPTQPILRSRFVLPCALSCLCAFVASLLSRTTQFIQILSSPDSRPETIPEYTC